MIGKRKKEGYEALASKSYGETPQGRDVHSTQQMERGEIRKMQTMGWRTAVSVMLAVLASVLVYLMWCGAASLGDYMRLSTAYRNVVKAQKEAQKEAEEDSDKSGSGGTSQGSGSYGSTAGGGDGEYHWQSSIFRENKGEDSVQTGRFGSGGESAGKSMYDEEEGIEIIQDGNAEESGTDGSMPDDAVDSESLAMDGSDADFSAAGSMSLVKPHFKFSLRPRSVWHVFWSLIAGLFTFELMIQFMKRNLKAQNMLTDMTDINPYDNDQHIAFPEEIQAQYDWFPDVGAHSSVSPTSMLSHMMLENKGVKRINMAVRQTEDVKDESGEIIAFKGEAVVNEDGDTLFEQKPMFDKKFAEELFKASDMPESVWKWFDVRKIPYNPGGKDRDKLKYETVMDLINDDWEFPEYEPQRPAGAYIVDTRPVKCRTA